MKKLIFLVALFSLWVQSAFAGINLEAVYPYNMEQRNLQTVYGGSTVPFYINATTFDVSYEQEAEVIVNLPSGFVPQANRQWSVEEYNDGYIAKTKWLLPADFGMSFDLLYVKADQGLAAGTREAVVELKSKNISERKRISFKYENGTAEGKQEKAIDIDKSKFNWYIQSVTLPVDNTGKSDDRAENGVIYIRDTALEGFRNRVTGEGATSWSAVFNHPAAHLLLDMRNPQKDVRVLRFKAELVDRATGKTAPGLCTSGKNNEDSDHGWAGETGNNGETTALISLDGKKTQSFIIPLYIDYFTVLEGDYSLRVTVYGNGQEKVQEVPLKIAKKHSLGMLAVGFSFICAVLVLAFAYKLKQCVYDIGAKGAITVALFAALAFGGITMPTTLIGDLLHVFLGPFSGLLTGLLSGMLQYLLIVSLLVLFRRPGVVSLLFFVKYMLTGIMFGHFTPLGFLSCCVSVVVLEAVLQLSGFYRQTELKAHFMVMFSILLGVTDAFTTFINMEQMMFFYRLYYADWYLALYMLVNGLLYSSIGSWLGYKTGSKLQQVMGE